MPRYKRTSPSPIKDSDVVLNVIREYKREAEAAARSRRKQNLQNWDMYFNRQDYSHKQEGQSTESLPKLAAGAEQMATFIKRALVQFGDWFSVDAPHNCPLSPEEIRGLLRLFLENMATSRYTTGSFYTLMSDAVKQALMESLMIFKVHGQHMTQRTFDMEPGDLVAATEPKLTTKESRVWRLRIDLVSANDYLPDPTGRRLYEIHTVERDLFDVVKSAEDGLYDKKLVNQIGEDYEKEYEIHQKRARHIGQDETTAPSFRRRVCIDEMWGVLLGPDGKPIMENCVTAVANGKYLIREPEKNPMWHGESPLVVCPVLRVPHSTHHKALYDDATELNIALNELFNLILDGGISKVWGVRQVRAHWLEDEGQISGGIAAAETLRVNETAPADAKVVETVSTGEVPSEALAVLNLVDRELQASMKTNDTRLGFLPPRAVKATEVVQAEQSSSTIIDGFAGDIEVDAIGPVLRKSWLTILQFADDIPAEDVVKVLGVNGAFALSRMSPAERYVRLGQRMGFSVMGLSATLARARDFQKFMAMSQGVATNPVLMESFVRRMSPDKTLDHLFRSLNLNPKAFEATAEEQAQVQQRIQNMSILNQVAAPGGGSPANPGGGGDGMSESRSEVNQLAEPTSGMLGG